jgi:hypothetical protein
VTGSSLLLPDIHLPRFGVGMTLVLCACSADSGESGTTRTGLLDDGETYCDFSFQDATGANSPVDEGAVLAALAAGSPQTVVWDLTLDEPEAPIHIAVARGAGVTRVVERSGSEDDACRPGPELEIPVVVTVTLGAELSGSFPGALYASDDAPHAIFSDDLYAEVALAGGWLEAAELAMAERGVEEAEWWLSMLGPWDQLSVSVQGWSDASGGSALWRGTAVTP